jgi:signal-transduction protein with cAMP-binding, CBS, and nucleotidyltransferase domain
METLEFVRQCPPFDLLDEVELERVAGCLECLEISAGTRLLKEGGETSRFLQIVRSGRLSREGLVALRQVQSGVGSRFGTGGLA